MFHEIINKRIMINKKIVLIVLGILIPLVYLIPLIPGWIKYQYGIKLLKEGKVISVGADRSGIIFELTDKSIINVKNPPIFIYNTRVYNEFKKCGNPCKNTSFFME